LLTPSRRAVVAGLTAGAGGLLLPRLAFGLGTASAIRVSEHGGTTRVAVDLSQNLDFSIFRLGDPYRIVIDMPELDWPAAQPPNGGLVHAVRYGLFQPGDSRLVIDLAEAADVKSASITPASGTTPARLVVDLVRTTREKFLAATGPQYRIGKFGPAQKPKVEEAKLQSPIRKSKKVIVVDPGHGGIDPGAIGVSGIYEKIITLGAARMLKTRLEDTGRYKVVLTRDRDVSLGLADRRDIAHDAQADLFISLHADSIPNKNIRGLSVYTLSEKASDAEAELLAEQENDADEIIGVDLSHETQEVRHILIDLAQRESMNLSTRLAGRLIEQLRREATVLRNGHRFAGFAVLKSPDIPSVLIEMGYLSNVPEETALKTDAYRARLMAAVVRGVDAHFGALQSAHR
jgi:N-acetylmuramoyl-L-alanine amidase